MAKKLKANKRGGSLITWVSLCFRAVNMDDLWKQFGCFPEFQKIQDRRRSSVLGRNMLKMCENGIFKIFTLIPISKHGGARAQLRLFVLQDNSNTSCQEIRWWSGHPKWRNNIDFHKFFSLEKWALVFLPNMQFDILNEADFFPRKIFFNVLE